MENIQNYKDALASVSKKEMEQRKTIKRLLQEKEELKKQLALHAVIDSNIINNRCECQEYDPVDVKLCAVGCSFSIGFAQYIAKEHYTLINQIGKIHYWRNEEFSKTTEQLLKDYKETLG